MVDLTIVFSSSIEDKYNRRGSPWRLLSRTCKRNHRRFAPSGSPARGNIVTKPAPTGITSSVPQGEQCVKASLFDSFHTSVKSAIETCSARVERI